MHARMLPATRRPNRSSSCRRFADRRAARLTTLGPRRWLARAQQKSWRATARRHRRATARRHRRATARQPRGADDVSGETAAVRSIPASQLARRERILEAAMELATEGGYDAVQMREVAERADVALGTLYRYFPSKVHLLVAAMGRTFQSLQESARVDGGDGTPQERVYRVVAAVTRYLARHRRLSGAMIRALMSADTDAAREVEEVGEMLVNIIASAHHDPESAPPTPAEREHDALVAHIIGKVWLTDVVTLLSGRMTVSQVLEDLERTIQLVMPE